MRTLLSDLRYACRILVRFRTSTLAALAILAVAVAANTAIFSLIDAVLLRPLPIRDADRVVRIEERHGPGRVNLTGATFVDLRDRARSLDGLASYRIMTPGLSAGGAPVQVFSAEVSEDYFRVLAGEASRGRTFARDDFAPGSQAVIVSQAIWERVLGSDPAAIGRRIDVNAQPAQIVGVMPPGFYAPGSPDIWRPQIIGAALLRNRRAHLFTVIGRLRRGTTLDAARQELAATAPGIVRDSGALDPDMIFTVSSLKARMVESVRTAMFVIWTAVGILLLIAAANVANLLLMQGASRGRELSIRTALGAGRRRLVRQLATESALLGAAGGLAGTALGAWSIPALRTVLPATVPRGQTLAVDLRVLAFGVLVALASAVLFGVAPALRLSRRDPAAALGDRAGTGRPQSRLRAGLVVAEVALTVVLLTGAGLLGRSLASVLRVDPGFDSDGVLTATLSLPSGRYGSADTTAGFYSQVLDGLRRVPGVAAAGVTGALPLTGTPATTMVPEGGTLDHASADVVTATPGFFQALAIPLKRGRLFDDNDRRGAAPVVVINETAARRLWPNGGNPLGRSLTMQDWGEPYRAEVVGIVGDIHQAGIDVDVAPATYYPLAQFPQTTLTQSIVVRTTGEPEALSSQLRDQIWRVDRNQPIGSIRPMAALVATTLAGRQFNVIILGTFALTAALVAAVGIYGIVAFAVGQRTREIGVRVALGARPRDVSRLVAAHALVPVAAGLVCGLAAALAASRLLEGLLFGVRPTDTVTLVAVAAAISAVAALACVGPIVRARGVDVAAAIRN